MPGLIACKRRWSIGSDDLFFPALGELGLRFLWLIAAASLYWSHLEHNDCEDANVLHSYLIGLQIWLVLVIVLNGIIVIVSTKGTIIQTRPRRHMGKLLYARTFLAALEIVWNVLGTMWAFTLERNHCESLEVVILVRVAVVTSWFLLCVIALGIWLVFDPLGTSKRSGVRRSMQSVDASSQGSLEQIRILLSSNGAHKANKVWEDRFRLLCCCCAAFDHNSQDAYTEVGVIFASFFDDVDLVPSDIAVGLLLLQERGLSAPSTQLKRCVSVQTPSVWLDSSSSSSSGSSSSSSSSREGSPQKEICPPVPVDPTMPVHGPPDWMTLVNASHFMKYARGIYGWPFYIYANCPFGLCRLWSDMSCCMCCRKSHQTFIEDDNCCLCHYAALRKMTEIAEEDLIYVSFHNRIYEVPFYVAVDHHTRSLVVAIRGTLSFRDALTDFNCECESLCADGSPQGALCHRGMFLAAQFVKKRLEESGSLATAITIYQNYGLVITGHSLGAGTASLLAFLMRPLYPNLKCFAYGPPGGLLNGAVIRYSQDFVMSVIVGDDLVPRLSYHSLVDLKQKLVTCLVECDQPKYNVFVRGCWSALTGCPAKYKYSTEEGSSRESSPGLQHTRPLLINSTSSQANDNNLPKVISRIKLYPPGRIMHVRQTSMGYLGRWMPASYFDQIVISPSMAYDHMPDPMQHILAQAAEGQIPPASH